MIAYRCHQCGASLESPESCEGNDDLCPACGVKCVVPLVPIAYKCSFCGTKLESAGELAGKEDVCPRCNHVSKVPMNRRQKAEQKERLLQQAESERQRQQLEMDRLRAQRSQEALLRETEIARAAQMRQMNAAENQPPTPLSGQGSPKSRRKNRLPAILGTSFGLIVVVLISVYFLSRNGTFSGIVPALNPPALQTPMKEVIKGDYRNSGIEVSLHYASSFDTSILVYDLRNVSGGNSMADVFRVFLQYAEKMQFTRFSQVRLCFKGVEKFRIDGGYFETLGRDYATENVVYTIRTFPEHLRTPDGSRAYSEWEGGILGVTERQMKDFDDFHHKWYMDEI